MKVIQHQLTNGLKVILIDTAAFPTLTTLLLVGAGSRYENKENNGVAHFFEHMAFKGSKKYPDTLVISSLIEGLGGVFNAFTAKDHTGYWIKSTNEHFKTVLDVLADMIQHPLLKEEEIEREKGVIIEEINLYEDTPYRKIGDYFEELLYDGNPLGFDIAGTKKTVKSFTRQTFVDYINKLYHPKNVVVVVAGGLGQDKNSKLKIENYLEIIENKFTDWENGDNKAGFEPLIEKQTKPQVFVKTKKTEQAHFCLGYRTFSFYDERRYALNLLTVILGGGMSSRLFIQVRERRGLCYYISTAREFYHDCGNIVTQAGVNNDLDKIKLAVDTIIKEQEKIAKGDLKKEELKKAKELIKGRLLLSMEDSFEVGLFFGRKKLLQNELVTPQEEIAKLEKVTPEEIINLAQEIFVPSRLNFTLIGPFEKEKLTGFF